MSNQVWFRAWTIWWCVTVLVAILAEVSSLSGPNVCMVHQRYNITKRVKYRAPMSVRTYVWCFSVPPRCSKWSTEMRDLTRLETDERTAEVAVCCPGYKMRDVSCVPICPSGRTGHGCSEECPPNKWGPNCVHECVKCRNGFCSPTTGECDCLDGWQGESCHISVPSTRATTLIDEILTTTKSSISNSFTKPRDPTTLTNRISASPPSTAITSSMATTTKPTPATIVSVATPVSSTLLTTPKANVYHTMPVKPPDGWNTTTTEEGTRSTESAIYNRTEIPASEGTSIHYITAHVTSATRETPITPKATSISSTPPSTVASKEITQTKEMATLKTETTKKSETTTKIHVTTTKFKPKEIWIKPTQKGDILTDMKVKHKNESANSRRKNDILENTTQKTIIVSIIPTSVSHATFKKMALTTASYIAQRVNTTSKAYKKSDQGITKSIRSQPTVTPFTIKILSSHREKIDTTVPNTTESIRTTNGVPIVRTMSGNILSTAIPISNTTLATGRPTNSMSTSTGASQAGSKTPNSSLTTINSPTNKKANRNPLSEITTKSNKITRITSKTFHKHSPHEIYATEANIKITKVPFDKTKYITRRNTKNHSPITTETAPEDEFHILTEPEHITAVMSDKERDHSSADLISVLSIAGGVMMTVITVAVIIVMVERCKRPNYEDSRKMNEFRMQAMIHNDVSPPYVRSIFHTPLPDPPASEKCHYQPISTLDRNLKQFMRPVVVQNISPIMLENFRGILECHYDHLPRRNYDFDTPLRSSVAPSFADEEELLLKRPLSVTETIEALKCEAKVNILDNTTAEPLYAEIPCWRPPSEHAIEVLNLNGEAVTEL